MRSRPHSFSKWARTGSRWPERGAIDSSDEVATLSREIFLHNPTHLIFNAKNGQADVAALRRCIYEYGCVLVQGIIPEWKIAECEEMITSAYDQCQRFIRLLGIPEDRPADDIADPQLQNFVRNVRIGQLFPGWLAALSDETSIYDVLMSDDSLRRFVHSLLGGEWYPGAAQTRRVSGDPSLQSKTFQRPIRMHCDGPILSRHTYSLNFWVPLVECGRDAPGLVLVPGPFRQLQEAHRHNLEQDFVDEVEHMRQQEFYTDMRDGLPRFRPEMARGDILIFHNWIMHASYVTAEMQKSRVSLELRFNAPRIEDFESFAGG
jgi:hypothetical protein